MRRSTWIPLVAVVIALVILFFIFFASNPGDGPVAGDVAEGDGVIATDQGVEAVDDGPEAVPEVEVEGE